jgi:hypothetical protein
MNKEIAHQPQAAFRPLDWAQGIDRDGKGTAPVCL